jgi:hypothetical protein
MDNVTKIDRLVACVKDPSKVFYEWDSILDTRSIPTYWKRKGTAVTLRSFGSQGNVISLQPYTHILGMEYKIKINGWIQTPHAFVFVADPCGLPSDVTDPYLVVAMASDILDYDRVLRMIRSSEVHPCSFEVTATIGYRDRLRREVRFDIPSDMV